MVTEVHVDERDAGAIALKKYKGIPEMPQEYWDYWKHEPPALKMGTRERPKSWRIGFNGPPGGGKSCSMAYMTAQQALLRGIPVFTIPESYYIRVPIRWEDKTYIFETQPISYEDFISMAEFFEGCFVDIDEANIFAGDSHRSMGNRNLFMADAVQVARHYGISLVYSVILSSWIDPRLKQLTDLLIYCTDHAMSAEAEEHGVEEGEWCNWTITDQSGQLSGKPYDIEPQDWNYSIHLKDFWGITDSFYKTDRMDARKKVSMVDDHMTIGGSAKAEEFRMGAERIVSSIKDWQSTDGAQFDDDGQMWMPSNELYKRASGDPLIMGKVLGNMGVTLGTGKKKGLWNVTSIAYLESSIPDKSKINNEGEL
jgi:hypothetical protein